MTAEEWSQEERELRIGWEISPQLREGLSFAEAANDEPVRLALQAAGRAALQAQQHDDTEQKTGGWQPYAD